MLFSPYPRLLNSVASTLLILEKTAAAELTKGKQFSVGKMETEHVESYWEWNWDSDTLYTSCVQREVSFSFSYSFHFSYERCQHLFRITHIWMIWKKEITVGSGRLAPLKKKKKELQNIKTWVPTIRGRANTQVHLPTHLHFTDRGNNVHLCRASQLPLPFTTSESNTTVSHECHYTNQQNLQKQWTEVSVVYKTKGWRVDSMFLWC